SAAMCFAWSGEGKVPPGRIALVGSQRSSDRGSSDATENLISAVFWAANGPKPGAIRGDAAVVVMHASSHDGVRKLHSTRRDAFRNVNSQPLAYVNIEGGKPSIVMDSVYKQELESNSAEVTTAPKKYSENVRIAQFIAGPYLHEDEIEAIIANGPQAIVIHGTGLGHLPI
ncbi:MAG: asparaginase domain-containing protein, partial [Candidatus Poseidoniaceae archaeon]